MIIINRGLININEIKIFKSNQKFIYLIIVDIHSE